MLVSSVVGGCVEVKQAGLVKRLIRRIKQIPFLPILPVFR
jgi:hypothetical protein